MNRLIIERASLKDVKEITRLFQLNLYKKFGIQSDNLQVLEQIVRTKLILTATLAVIVKDKRKSILGFASFDYNPALDESNDRSQIENLLACGKHYGAVESNYLCLKFFGLSDPCEMIPVLSSIMDTLFAAIPTTDVVLYEAHDEEVFLEGLSEIFDQMGQCHSESKVSNATQVYGCLRVRFRPNLLPREARVEDYDDLVQIFDTQTDVLKDTYGEFFLAELIECQNASNKAIVGVEDDRAVGFMCVSSDVDMRLIDASFDLSGFENLQHNPESKCADSGNLIVITLFCIDQSKRDRARDILETAFQCFPDAEYCGLTLPQDRYEASLLPFFVPVPRKERAPLSQSLYLLHRDSLKALFYPAEQHQFEWITGHQITVASPSDANQHQHSEELHAFVASIENHEQIEQDMKTCETLSVYVQGQLIAIAVLKPADVSNFDGLFHIRDIPGIDSENPTDPDIVHAQILHFVIHPYFIQFAREVLREMMRASRKHVLHYLLHPGTSTNRVILEQFAQVEPRRNAYVQFHKGQRQVPDANYALFTLTKSALATPRRLIVSRLVVVGASDTGLSAIESLLVNRDACYVNISLISPGGIPNSRVQGVRNLCTNGTGQEYNSEIVDRLALQARIDVIDNKVVEIDREARRVVLDNGEVVEYDNIVLSTGLQDTSLARICGISHYDIANKKHLRKCLYTVGGDMVLANQFRQIVQAFHVNGVDHKCVVYGATVEAVMAVNALLDLGIPGNRIVLAHPCDKEYLLSCFSSDQWTSTRVEDYLAQVGVTLKANHLVTRIEQGKEKIRAAHFLVNDPDAACATNRSTSNEEVTERIECELFISAGVRDIDTNIFEAISNSSLVYDGRLVVNSVFQTVDSHIFGAGTCAKFSRRVPCKLPMERFDSREVGQRLASSLVTVLDPTNSRKILVPTTESFRKAKRFMYFSSLPGQVEYMHAQLPSWDGKTKGVRTLTTETKNSTCTIRIDKHDRIAGLTCGRAFEPVDGEELSRAPLPPLERLVGMHIAYINGIEDQLDRGYIKDLLEFLAEDWATVLYHDLLTDYLSEFHSADEEIVPIVEELMQKYCASRNSEAEIRMSRTSLIGPSGERLPAGTRAEIQRKLMAYLSMNRDVFDMYYLGGEEKDASD